MLRLLFISWCLRVSYSSASLSASFDALESMSLSSNSSGYDKRRLEVEVVRSEPSPRAMALRRALGSSLYRSRNDLFSTLRIYRDGGLPFSMIVERLLKAGSAIRRVAQELWHPETWLPMSCVQYLGESIEIFDEEKNQTEADHKRAVYDEHTINTFLAALKAMDKAISNCGFRHPT